MKMYQIEEPREFLGITKPSEAIEAMLRGLKAVHEEGVHKIDMSTFGEVRDGTCFGCAATWALQELVGKPMTAENFRYGENNDTWSAHAEYAGVDYHQIVDFECAVDNSRHGHVSALLWFFGVSAPDAGELQRSCSNRGEWALSDYSDETQEREIPKVAKFAKYLKKRGL
jgi:hypothetical protein